MRIPHLLLAGATLATLATGQTTPAPGWQLQADPALFGEARAYLTDGSYVTFDGVAVDLRQSDGTLIQSLGSLTGFKFPSFIEVLPGETTCLLGESSAGNIYEVDLVNGGMTVLANLTFNYDLEVDATPGFAYVSAALGGFGFGNDIVRLDLTTGATEIVAHVDGPSGALTVNDQGDVYYVTQASAWPIPKGSSDIIRWDDAELDTAMVPLSEADADTVVTGLNGGTGLRHDPVTQSLLVIDTNFSGLSAVRRFSDSTGSWIEDVLESPDSMNGLQLFPGTGPSILAGFQPAGASLRVTKTDFNLSLTDSLLVEPKRPTITFSGPPAGQSGVATVTVTGAMPNATVRIATSDDEFELPAEVANDFGVGVPYFLAFDPQNLIRRSQPLATDASGDMTLTYVQPVGFEGEILFQALLEGPGGVPLGTSEHVVND